MPNTTNRQPVRRTYVISDLHGRFDLLTAALAKIEGREPGKVVFTGDYVDRGPESCHIINRLMAGPTSSDWEWVCLKGNHEEMMVETVGMEIDPLRWLGNGGDATLMSYGLRPGQGFNARVVPSEHIDWLEQLPLLHTDRYRVYVHAGIDPSEALDQQDTQVLLWHRYRKYENAGFPDMHVVHGHTPYKDGPIVLTQRTDLDTFAWKTGRLVVGVFDDSLAGGPSGLIEIKAA
jgi:serine/threonine protein phosphatase 1